MDRRARTVLVIAVVALAAAGAALFWIVREREVNTGGPMEQAAARGGQAGGESAGAGSGGGGGGEDGAAKNLSVSRQIIPNTNQTAQGPGASVSGVVLDPDGKPLAAATVRARLETAKTSGTGAQTGANGAYTVAPLEGGVYQIEARAPGFRVETLAGVVLHAGERLRNVDFVLDRGERVLGVVLNPEGRPAADATVAARPLGAKRDAEPEAAGRTGKDGTFEVTGLSFGKKELVATAEGYRRSAPVIVEIAARTAARIELRLEHGVFVAGRVTTSKGAPAAGARVTATPEGGGGPFGGGRLDGGGEATVGEDGRYRVDGLAGRRFRVTAHPPGTADAGLAEASKGGVKANAEDCDLQLAGGATIAGHVFGAGEKAPIEGATLGISDRGFSASATTGPDGSYVLTGVPPGDWTVKALAASKAPVDQVAKNVAEDHVTTLDFELAAGGVIDGTVFAQKDGHPLEGAIVRVIASGGGGGPGRGRGGPGGGPGEEFLVEALASGADFGEFMPADKLEEMLAKNTVTDSRGHFRITDLPVGPQRVYAAHADYPGAAALTRIDAPGGHAEVEIGLPEGGGIAGRVSDAGGSPRPEEMVVAFSFTGRMRTAKTTSQGEYEIRGLAPGAYFVSLGVEIRARFAAQGGARVDPQAQGGGLGFTAKAANVEAARVTRVDFGAEPLAIVTGKIVRADAPAADEQVNFFPDGGALGLRGVATDQNGVYVVELPAGNYVVRVANVSQNLTVPQGTARLELDLRLPQGALSGRTVNAATGEAIRARVELYKAERKAADSLVSVLGALSGDTNSSDKDGTFQLSGLAPGLFTITAQADGFAMARHDGIEVPSDGTASGVELALEPGGIFRGRVTDERGNSVPNASIWIVDVTAKDLGSGNPPRADEEGKFEIKRFAPGKYRVTVLEDTHAPWRQIVDFPGGTIDLAPVMTTGGTLEIAVVDGAGRPIPGAAVDLRYPDGDRVITGFIDFVQPTLPTGPDGKLRRPRLPAGPLTGTVSVPNANPPRQGAFEAVIVNRAEQMVPVRVR